MIDIQLHEPVFPYDPDRVRRVKVIAFNDQDRILSFRQGRKYSILCGKVEWDDEDAEDAARREAIEAANVKLGDLRVSSILEGRNDKGEPVYTLVYSGRVASEDPLLPKQKRKHRFLKKISLLKHAETPVLHELIDMAEFFLPENANLGEYHVAG